MAAPLLLHHSSSLEHDTGIHPERAGRIVAIERALAARDWLGWEVRDSPEVEREVLRAVHPDPYVERIATLCAAGGGELDLDTVVSAGSYRAALHAAGGAVALVDALMADGRRVGASLHRPPGHHALRAHAMGFCLFNNMAVAVRRALDRWGAERVMVLDWDVHHGNGTNDIFRSSPEVLFVSVHQWPLYPGTGPSRDTGAGPGLGFTVNLPVPPGTGDATWCSLVEHVAVPLGLEYRPEVVLVSAGYDGHARDPIGDCTVTTAGFAAMAGSARRLADELGAPLGIVLEGGYDLDALEESVVATLDVVGAPEAPQAGALPVHPLAAAAAARLAERWPRVGDTAR